MIAISVSHNSGIDELKDFIYSHLKQTPKEREEGFSFLRKLH